MQQGEGSATSTPDIPPPADSGVASLAAARLRELSSVADAFDTHSEHPHLKSEKRAFGRFSDLLDYLLSLEDEDRRGQLNGGAGKAHPKEKDAAVECEEEGEVVSMSGTAPPAASDASILSFLSTSSPSTPSSAKSTSSRSPAQRVLSAAEQRGFRRVLSSATKYVRVLLRRVFSHNFDDYDFVLKNETLVSFVASERVLGRTVTTSAPSVPEVPEAPDDSEVPKSELTSGFGSVGIPVLPPSFAPVREWRLFADAVRRLRMRVQRFRSTRGMSMREDAHPKSQSLAYATRSHSKRSSRATLRRIRGASGVPVSSGSRSIAEIEEVVTLRNSRGAAQTLGEALEGLRCSLDPIVRIARGLESHLTDCDDGSDVSLRTDFLQDEQSQLVISLHELERVVDVCDAQAQKKVTVFRDKDEKIESAQESLLLYVFSLLEKACELSKTAGPLRRRVTLADARFRVEQVLHEAESKKAEAVLLESRVLGILKRRVKGKRVPACEGSWKVIERELLSALEVARREVEDVRSSCGEEKPEGIIPKWCGEAEEISRRLAAWARDKETVFELYGVIEAELDIKDEHPTMYYCGRDAKLAVVRNSVILTKNLANALKAAKSLIERSETLTDEKTQGVVKLLQAEVQEGLKRRDNLFQLFERSGAVDSFVADVKESLLSGLVEGKLVLQGLLEQRNRVSRLIRPGMDQAFTGIFPTEMTGSVEMLVGETDTMNEKTERWGAVVRRMTTVMDVFTMMNRDALSDHVETIRRCQEQLREFAQAVSDTKTFVEDGRFVLSCVHEYPCRLGLMQEDMEKVCTLHAAVNRLNERFGEVTLLDVATSKKNASEISVLEEKVVMMENTSLSILERIKNNRPTIRDFLEACEARRMERKDDRPDGQESPPETPFLDLVVTFTTKLLGELEAREGFCKMRLSQMYYGKIVMTESAGRGKKKKIRKTLLYAGCLRRNQLHSVRHGRGASFHVDGKTVQYVGNFEDNELDGDVKKFDKRGNYIGLFLFEKGEEVMQLREEGDEGPPSDAAAASGPPAAAADGGASTVHAPIQRPLPPPPPPPGAAAGPPGVVDAAAPQDSDNAV